MEKTGETGSTLWFKDAQKTIVGMKRVFGPMFGIPYFPDFILRPYTLVEIPVSEDGDICTRFAHGKNQIRPLIFSHGLGAHSSFYTATYHALAAHGYLVIAINHQDESCLFTEDKDGRNIPF